MLIPRYLSVLKLLIELLLRSLQFGNLLLKASDAVDSIFILDSDVNDFLFFCIHILCLIKL